MEDTTHNSFEEQWQKAFDDASQPPSEAVWEKIELGLENNIPPKSGNNSYYIGAISAIILGVCLWFFMPKKEVKNQVQVIENKTISIDEKVEKVASKVEEKFMIKPHEKIEVKKVFIPEKQEIIEPEIVAKEPENQERIMIDSIDFMSPIIITKKVNSELTNPTINIPFESVPYYEKQRPLPKKKSIWDRVRISGGVGVYQ